MIDRILKLDLPEGQSAFLWGPRQTGKTTLLKQRFPTSIRYDLLQTDLEELKTAIQDKLQPKKSEQKSEQKPEPDPASDSTPDLGLSGPTRIYLICDQRDQDAIQALDDYLYDQEFDPARPATLPAA